MTWGRLDLNLLIVFDAVAREGTVARAGVSLSMSPSAVSHALARLRHALGDDLFVRTPVGMEPTPYARRLVGPVRATLKDLHDAVAPSPAFDAATAEHHFRIAVDNRSALVLAEPLAAAMALAAPGVRLDLRPSGTLDVPGRLDAGDLDLALGALASPGERFSDRVLFDDGFRALARRDHPAAAEGEIDVAALAAYPHFVITSMGEEPSLVDAAFARHGLVRRVALRAPLLTAASSLTRSDLVAVVGERMALAFARTEFLTALRLPFAMPRIPTVMLWHRRLQDVEAHRWLRAFALRTSRTVRVS